MKTKTSIILLLLCTFLVNFSAKSQSERIQTAIIFQFTRLIEWCPSGKQGNFTIGVLCDNNALIKELSLLQGRSVANQPIEVKKISSADDMNSVNIVLVSRSRIEELPLVISKIGSSCTLVIADQEGAAKQGAAISFVDDNGKIHFEINPTIAKKQSLTVSNDLIKLAKNVF